MRAFLSEFFSGSLLKKQCGTLIVLSAVVGAGTTFVCAGPAQADVATVTVLDRGEPFEAMTHHAGILWVGKSRANFSSSYSLEAYAGKAMIGKVTFPHSATYVHPYGQNSVIVVGTGYQPNLTHYTIVEHNGGRLTTRTTQIPMDAWARQWLGTVNGREYFTDPGGNPADSDNPNLTQPAQTFFTMSAGGRPRYLTTRLRLPLGGVKLGNVFYVYNAESIGDPRSNIYRLDPASGQIKPVFSEFRNGISGVALVPGANLIAAIESGSGQMVLVNPADHSVVGAVNIEGSPRSIAAFGKCMIVGSRDTNSVTAIDVSVPSTPTVVAVAAVGLSQDEFQLLDRVSADVVTGQVFARSNFPCNPMIQTCDKDWNRVVVFTGDDAQKMAAGCR